jgi:hypothetical protein
VQLFALSGVFEAEDEQTGAAQNDISPALRRLSRAFECCSVKNYDGYILHPRGLVEAS